MPSLGPIALRELVGKQLEVKTIDGEVFVGHLYVADPQSGDLVLTQEGAKTILIMGHQVDAMAAKEAPIRQDYVFSSQPQQEEGEGGGGDDVARDRLLAWFKQNLIPCRLDGEALLVEDSVRIEPPYNAGSCYCTNTIILARIRDLIATMPT